MRSANQKNKNWYEALLKLLNNIYTNIDVGFPARVISYDKKRHVADIQPLFNFSDGTKKAQLLDVPVAENCYIVDEILERLKPDFSVFSTYVEVILVLKLLVQNLKGFLHVCGGDPVRIPW